MVKRKCFSVWMGRFGTEKLIDWWVFFGKIPKDFKEERAQKSSKIELPKFPNRPRNI
jgi:hypothetical protein